MPNGFTITNMPEAAEPSTLAEVTALVTAVGTALGGVVVPVVILLALWMFRNPISEVIKNLSSLEGPGGMKVQTHERLGHATEAVAEMTAEEIAAAEPPVSDINAEKDNPRPDRKPEAEPATKPAANETGDNTEAERESALRASQAASTETYMRLLKGLKKIDAPSSWYVGSNISHVDDETFSDLLRAHPASAVLFAWNEVETRLQALAKARGIATKMNRAPARVLISALKRAGSMPIELADLLRELMEIRADAVHKGGQISETTAIDFRRSAEVASREIIRQIWRAIPSDDAWVKEG